MFLVLTMSRISTFPQTAILQWYGLRSCQPWPQPHVFIHCRQGSDNHLYISQIPRTVARVSEQFPPTPSLHLVSNMRGRSDRWFSQIICHASAGNPSLIPRTHGGTRDWLLKPFWIPHMPWHTRTYSQAHLSFTHNKTNTVVDIQKQKKCRAFLFCKDMLSSTSPHGWWAWVMGSGEWTSSTASLHVLPRWSRLACCLLRLGVWLGLVKFDFGIITENLRRGKEWHWITCDSSICMSPNKNLENHYLPSLNFGKIRV